MAGEDAHAYGLMQVLVSERWRQRHDVWLLTDRPRYLNLAVHAIYMRASQHMLRTAKRLRREQRRFRSIAHHSEASSDELERALHGGSGATDFVDDLYQDRGRDPETARRIRLAVDSLPTRQRTVVRLVHFEQGSPSEAARKFGMSRSSVYDALRGGERRLRQLLGDLRHEEV